MTIPGNQPQPANDSLRTAVSSYPVFEANQLLSFRDLNDVREYLDQQTRLTRVCLTGAGIVCGLVPRASGGTIEISAGCGVTTEGFLIHLEACTLTHTQEIEVPRGAFLGTDSAPDDVIVALELFADASEDRTALSASLIANKVVALLLECHDVKNESCLDDCDEKGTRREFTVRKLLLDREDALALALDNFNPIVEGERRLYPGWELEDLLIGRYGLADLYLERFGHTPADGEPLAQVKLATIESYDIFLERYGAVIEAGAARVAEALERAHVALSPLFSSGVGELPELPADRFDLAELGGGRRLEIQYVYGHLGDLILAYEEFRAVAFDLMDVCCAEVGWFPKHLFLGAPLTGGDELPIPPSTVRTPYVQPPVYNGNRARADAARLMYRRLQALIESFTVPDPTRLHEVRITPSRWSDAPLSARAIPYYYDPERKLHRVWNADRHRKARDRRVHGYFRIGTPRDPRTGNPPYDDPLVFDFERHDFYRVEGHVGREKQVAVDRIARLRECYNLAFDLVVLKLGELNEVDFEHDCEFRILQAQYTKLRTDLVCALQQLGQGGPIDQLLAQLPEKLDDFVYETFEEAFNAVLHEYLETGGHEEACLLGHDPRPFLELSELHTERKEEVRAQTLFHEFARKHPGMEHRAGVPRGGTFVLVYDDLVAPATRQEREIFGQFQELQHSPLWAALDLRSRLSADAIEKVLADTTRQIVVADFCLPYLCCSDCPPTALVLERPRPTLLIEQTAFCADDAGEHDFIVDPLGGEISGSSPGTHRDGFRYYFVPKETGLESGGEVVVTYTVDGVSRTLTLEILAVPEATFNEIPPSICRDAEPVLLTGTPPGHEFSTEIDGVVGQIGIDPVGEEVFFDASQVDPAVGGTPVTIIYTVTDENGCTGSHTQVTTVWPVPEATFNEIPPNLCRDAEPVLLTGTPPGHKFSTEIDGVVGQVGIDPVGEEVFFDASQVDPAVGGTPVTIIYTVTDENGCTGSHTQVTTVWPVPEATFNEIPPNICRDAEPVLLTGTPPGGEFSTKIDGVVGQAGLFPEDGKVFFAPNAEDVQPGKEIRIIYEVTENECTGSHTQVTTVWPEPSAGFSGLEKTYCSDGEGSELVADDPSVVESTFTIDGVEVTTFDPASVDFATDQYRVEVTVYHTVIDAHGCSATDSKPTTVYRRPEGGFDFGTVERDGDEFVFPIGGITPEQDGNTFQYSFRWTDRRGPQEEQRVDSTNFTLEIPAGELVGMENLTVVLVVTNGPCEGKPSVPQTVSIPWDREPPIDDPSDVLRRRIENGRGGLAALAAEHAGLSPALLDAAGGLLESDPSGSPDALVEDFGAFVDRIVAGYRRLRSDERREAYRSIAKLAAETVLDRVAVNAPSDASRGQATEKLKKLGEIGLDLVALRDEWVGGEMARVLDPERVDVARSLFEE